MSDYDLKCPIGYGLVSFVGGGVERRCPVSGRDCYTKCDVRPFDNSKVDNHPMNREDAKK